MDPTVRRPLGRSGVEVTQLGLGGATYGSFTQEGCTDFDAVCLMGIGGEGLSVSAALVTELGAAKLTFEEHQAQIESQLTAAGKKLAGKLRRGDRDRLAILIPDAHAPKNASLVAGLPQAVRELNHLLTSP